MAAALAESVSSSSCSAEGAAAGAGGGGNSSSRHEKSLGLLTTKFVSLLQEAKDGVLDLKAVRRGGLAPERGAGGEETQKPGAARVSSLGAKPRLQQPSVELG
ncbi:UNVERIFIED_CONTAM: hypothetical protein K2H54_036853 [Gekko kuhli]